MQPDARNCHDKPIIVTPKVELIRKVEDSVEFFTVAATGESGISDRGLERLVGVSHRTVANLKRSMATKAPSKALEPFVGKDFSMATKGQVSDTNLVTDVSINNAGFCVAVIGYYAFDARQYKGKEVAQYSFHRFAELGFNAWVQQITGWQRPAPDASTDAVFRRLLVENHRLMAQLEGNGLPLLQGDAMLPAVAICQLHGYQIGTERGAVGAMLSKVVGVAGYRPVRARDSHTGGLVNFYPAYNNIVVSAIHAFYSRRGVVPQRLLG